MNIIAAYEQSQPFHVWKRINQENSDENEYPNAIKTNNGIRTGESLTVEKVETVKQNEELIDSKIKSTSINAALNMQNQKSEEMVETIIKVVATGGSGANALNRMIDSGLQGVESIAINTDSQDLNIKSKASVKVCIGTNTTKGRGAGGDPEKGEKAALEDAEKIANALKGAHMVFVAAGMGGGTGTGSAHVIAKIAREQGALTVAVVTTPFDFDGRYKMMLAKKGIDKLREVVDAIIIIHNQNLFKMITDDTRIDEAYAMADQILCNGVKGISEIITKTGFQNIDFSDVETVLKGKGEALLGIGCGVGDNRAINAVTEAINSPLMEDTRIDGATNVLINVVAPNEVSLKEWQNMAKYIGDKCDSNVHIINGLRYEKMTDNSIQITVIATGFKNKPYKELKNEKPQNNDIIDQETFKKMKELTKKPEYLKGLPPKEFQDDLEISPLFRNSNLQLFSDNSSVNESFGR